MPEKLLSPGRPEQSRMSEPMALLMAHNAALQRADAAVDPMTNAAAAMTTAQSGDWAGYSSAVPALGAGLGSPVPGQTGSEAAIETFKRRMRERQAQVDVAEFDSEEQEVLKRALWDSLRRRVEGLREDNWMFEVEGGEGRVEVG